MHLSMPMIINVYIWCHNLNGCEQSNQMPLECKKSMKEWMFRQKKHKE